MRLTTYRGAVDVPDSHQMEEQEMVWHFLSILKELSATYTFGKYAMCWIESFARSGNFYHLARLNDLGISRDFDDMGIYFCRKEKWVYLKKEQLEYADRRTILCIICTVFGIDLLTGKPLEETKEAFPEVDAEDVPPLRCCICGEKLPVVLAVGKAVVTCPACATVFDMMVTEKKITLELKV